MTAHPHLRLVRDEPIDVAPSDAMAFRGRNVDWCQRLEDAAHAAQRCGQPVLLSPDVALQIAFYLRLGGAA